MDQLCHVGFLLRLLLERSGVSRPMDGAYGCFAPVILVLQVFLELCSPRLISQFIWNMSRDGAIREIEMDSGVREQHGKRSLLASLFILKPFSHGVSVDIELGE